MRRVVVLVVVLVLAVGGVVGDVMAREAAERRIERQVTARVPRYTVDARIDSSPFVLRLLASGEIAKVRVRLFAADADPGRGDIAESVDVRLFGARLDRAALFDGDARLTGVDRGTAEVWISASTLGDLVGVPVAVEGSSVVIGPPGRAVPVGMEVRGSSLVFRAPEGPEWSVEIPQRFAHCPDTEVVVRPRTVVLTCAFTELPGELLASGTAR